MMNSKLDYLDRRSKAFSAASLALVILPYLAITTPFLCSDKYPGHDSAWYLCPAFEAIADGIGRDHSFPRCFWVSGGTRLSYTHISFLHFVPHRVVGYALYCVLPASALFVYKLQMILGMVVTATAWWLVLKRWFGSAVTACFGAQMILMGGIGITFHQEHVGSTVHLIPWFILALQNLKTEPGQIVPCAAIVGISLSTMQPQIQLISLILIVGAAFCYRSSWRQWTLPISRTQAVVALFLFFLGTLPSLYLYLNLEQLASPIRGMSQFSPPTYEEFSALNRMQVSSASYDYFKQYVTMPGGSDDRCAFFVGRVGLLLSFIGLLTGRLRMLPVAVCLVFFSLLTLGINSPVPIPKILFMARFPFISLFRQWYHFFPMINFCLSILACFGLTTLLRLIRWPFVAILVIGSLLALQTFDLIAFDGQYLAKFTGAGPTAKLEASIFTKDNVGPASLFVYKSRYLAPQQIPSGIEVANAPPSLGARVGAWAIVRQELVLDVAASQKTVLKVPLNYDLSWNVLVDGVPTDALRVNEVIMGVPLDPGNHRVQISPTADLYGPIVLVQVVLYAYALGSVARMSWKKLFSFDDSLHKQG